MRRRAALGALAPMLVGGCLRLDAANAGTDEESTVPSTRRTASTTATGLAASAEMTSPIESGVAGEIVVQVANEDATAFEGEVLLLFDREVQSTRPVEVAASAETEVALSVDALDVGERTVTVEVRGQGVREVVFEETLGTATNPVALEWGSDYSPENRTRAWSYVCHEIAIESPSGTLASYNVGADTDGADGLTFYNGTYLFNPEQEKEVSRWFGGSARGTVMGFEDVDLEAATTMRLTGKLAKTLDSLQVVCRMEDLAVAERTWERDGEHTIPLTLRE